MPSALTNTADRQRAYRAALRDLARLARLQRQTAALEALQMAEGL